MTMIFVITICWCIPERIGGRRKELLLLRSHSALRLDCGNSIRYVSFGIAFGLWELNQVRIKQGKLINKTNVGNQILTCMHVHMHTHIHTYTYIHTYRYAHTETDRLIYNFVKIPTTCKTYLINVLEQFLIEILLFILI